MILIYHTCIVIGELADQLNISRAKFVFATEDAIVKCQEAIEIVDAWKVNASIIMVIEKQILLHKKIPIKLDFRAYSHSKTCLLCCPTSITALCRIPFVLTPLMRI